MESGDLDERGRMVLKAVVLSYIKTAFPVGSRTITKNFPFGLSAATIRNIMADLEEMGYLFQPHTSAGRMPTEKGYRFYVDSFMQEGKGEWGEEGEAIHEEFQLLELDDVEDLLREACRVLSFLSRYVGFVLTPNVSHAVFKKIEFIKLKKCRIMGLFVSEDGFVRNKMIEADEDFSQEELDRFSSYLNIRYKGMSLQEIRRALVIQMQQEKEMYDDLLRKALELARRTIDVPQAGELYVEGAANILNCPEFSDVERMRALFQAFETKANIVKLLDRCLDLCGVHVFIGSENSFLGTDGCSLILANYGKGQQPLGTLGIIGPTRMEYSRVIPLVGKTAWCVSRFLDEIV